MYATQDILNRESSFFEHVRWWVAVSVQHKLTDDATVAAPSSFCMTHCQCSDCGAVVLMGRIMGLARPSVRLIRNSITAYKKKQNWYEKISNQSMLIFSAKGQTSRSPNVKTFEKWRTSRVSMACVKRKAGFTKLTVNA